MECFAGVAVYGLQRHRYGGTQAPGGGGGDTHRPPRLPVAWHTAGQLIHAFHTEPAKQPAGASVNPLMR